MIIDSQSHAFVSLQDGLIQQCGETMKENVSVKTVCGYYSSASIYGLDSVMKK
jgi:BTB/POZ domain-containing protein 13